MPNLEGSPRLRALTRARVIGSAALGVVAQFAVDTPASYLGARDEVTVIGSTYALVLLVACALACLLISRHGAGWLIALILAGNVGVFLPALISDPVVAGLVVVWNLVLLVRQFLPVPVEAGPPALPCPCGLHVAL